MSRAADIAVAAATLWNVAQRDTGQSSVCAKLLLGLYNGQRFPFALTDLRRLDCDLRRAAFDLMGADASGGISCEVHDLLNRATGRTDFGNRFEHLAHDWRMKGRCTREHLGPPPSPRMLVIKLPATGAAAGLRPDQAEDSLARGAAVVMGGGA